MVLTFVPVFVQYLTRASRMGATTRYQGVLSFQCALLHNCNRLLDSSGLLRERELENPLTTLTLLWRGLSVNTASSDEPAAVLRGPAEMKTDGSAPLYPIMVG